MASPRGSSFQADEVSSYFEIGVCPGSPPSYQQDSVSNNVPVCQNDIEQLVGCDETVIMTDSAVPEAKERLASQSVHTYHSFEIEEAFASELYEDSQSYESSSQSSTRPSLDPIRTANMVESSWKTQDDDEILLARGTPETPTVTEVETTQAYLERISAMCCVTQSCCLATGLLCLAVGGITIGLGIFVALSAFSDLGTPLSSGDIEITGLEYGLPYTYDYSLEEDTSQRYALQLSSITGPPTNTTPRVLYACIDSMGGPSPEAYAKVATYPNEESAANYTTIQTGSPSYLVAKCTGNMGDMTPIAVCRLDDEYVWFVLKTSTCGEATICNGILHLYYTSEVYNCGLYVLFMFVLLWMGIIIVGSGLCCGAGSACCLAVFIAFCYVDRDRRKRTRIITERTVKYDTPFAEEKRHYDANLISQHDLHGVDTSSTTSSSVVSPLREREP